MHTPTECDHMYLTDPLQFEESASLHEGTHYKPPLLIGLRVDCGGSVIELAKRDRSRSSATVSKAEISLHTHVEDNGGCFYGPCNGADYFVFLKGFWGAVRTPRWGTGEAQGGTGGGQ